MRNGFNRLWNNLRWVSCVQHLDLPNIIHFTGQSVRQTPNQILKAYSFPLDDAESSASALEAVCSGNGGRCPDAVFLCAGASRPGFFVEEDESSLRRGTIYSPGYIEENKTKPKITLKIEESDEGMQPDAAAQALLQGVEQGYFHISGDLLGNLFRSTTRGASPHNNVLVDIIFNFVGWIGLTLWRRGVDASIMGHRSEHEGYLARQGFFEPRNSEPSEQR
ncbi:hypothetical protein C0989_007178 [Termitomyces sp. Mn162]|nr:hypothetical protein C0989_007178 [Termitomyces sp. Mn162]